jgi:hypothetical protein
MVNPKYLINISYAPSHVTGQQLVNIGGVTQSMPTYGPSYFIAGMPEVKLSATGSTYEDALDNLLIVVNAAPNTGNEPLGNIRTW